MFLSLKHYVPHKSFTVAGVRGKAVGRGTELQAGTWRVQLPMASFQSRYGADFVSASNRNEEQECFFGGKGSR